MSDHEVVARISYLCASGDACLELEREARAPLGRLAATQVDAADDTGLGPSSESSWLEIEMVGEDDRAAAGVSYRVEAPGRTPYEGVLDDRGFVRLDGLQDGEWRITFPGLDAEAWALAERLPARTSPLRPSTASWRLSERGRDGQGPVRHRVDAGECASSIAFRYGFYPRTIWEHAENESLRTSRGDPHVLLAGDEVFVPPLRQRSVTAGAGHRHRFRRHGVPEQFRIRLLDDDRPRAAVAYELEVDGVRQRGASDAEGWIAAWISPDARRGVLVLSADERYELNLGRLDPIEAERGIISRLRNLGHVPVDNEEENALYVAILAFQRANGLPPTGQVDEATRRALLRAHGS